MNAPKLQSERCTTTSAVMLFADGELDPARSLEIESHLERCASCREEFELARAVRKSLRRSASATPGTRTPPRPGAPFFHFQ